MYMKLVIAGVLLHGIVCGQVSVFVQNLCTHQISGLHFYCWLTLVMMHRLAWAPGLPSCAPFNCVWVENREGLELRLDYAGTSKYAMSCFVTISCVFFSLRMALLKK